jgi:hypothetical protein
MNDLWLARISSLSNEVGLYVVLLEVLLFMPNSLIRHSNWFNLLITLLKCISITDFHLKKVPFFPIGIYRMYVVLTRITFFSADVVNLSAKIILPTLKLQNVAKSEDNWIILIFWRFICGIISLSRIKICKSGKKMHLWSQCSRSFCDVKPKTDVCLL